MVYKGGTSLKKRLAAFCLVLVAVAASITAVHSVKTVMTEAQGQMPLEPALPTIVIDAGHGGFDGGAVGVDGIVEKDINLAIAKKLQLFFAVNGFPTVMTREEDRSLEDPGLETVRKRKNSDIHNRKALADSYGDCILLSIHQNKFPQSKYFGAQVFYGPKNPQSQQMGELLQQRMVEMLQPENTRKAKPCGDCVYLIYHAQMPALLVECGFLSNREDAQKLSDPAYQDKVAFTIFTAVAEASGWRIPEADQEESLDRAEREDNENGGNKE